eukprot:s3581_g1.t1
MFSDYSCREFALPCLFAGLRWKFAPIRTGSVAEEDAKRFAPCRRNSQRVTAFQIPSRTPACGARGGFPCQAGLGHGFGFFDNVAALVIFPVSEHLLGRESLVVATNKGFWIREVLCSSMCSRFSISSQRAKGAGRQSGVPSLPYCLTFAIRSRQFIYLENVKSILSKQKDMKKLMRFLIQAPHAVPPQLFFF